MGLSGFVAAFSLVFVAEMGDKTQLATLGLATRFGSLTVILGVAIGAAAINLVSATLGAALAAAVPLERLRLIAGIAFIGLGLSFLIISARKNESLPCAPEAHGTGSLPRAVLTTAAGFFVAEMGDKTMLATALLSARYGAAAAWAGSTAALISAGSLAVLLGRLLSRHLVPERLRLVSALAFLGFGLAAVLEVVRGS